MIIYHRLTNHEGKSNTFVISDQRSKMVRINAVLPSAQDHMFSHMLWHL